MLQLMNAQDVAADQSAWHKARLSGIGGSEIGTIMQLEGHHGSPYRLWLQKTGRWAEPPSDDRRLEFGNYCENFIAWCLAQDRPDLHLTPGGLYRHDERAWQIATFDRLAHDTVRCHGGDGCALVVPSYTVQMKTDAGWRDWERDGMPESYLAQCIWEASLAGTDVALLPVFDRVAADVTRMMRITMDDEANRYLEALLEGAEVFWELVTSDTPPPMDGSPATTEALRQMYPGVDRDRSVRLPTRLAARWRRASKGAKAGEERRRKYLNTAMVRAAGDDGVLAGIWTVRDPGGGEDIKVASVSAGPRAGYTTKPKDSVVTVHPSRSWQP
jgi:predicted phage-related endonuclease